MGRAERRRAQKNERKANNATYNLTKAQLDYAIEKGIRNKLAAIKEQASNEAVNKAMILTLSLPLKVLLDEYEFDGDISEFADKVIEYYSKWQDGEIDICELRKTLWNNAGIKIEDESYICQEGEVE